MGVGGAESVSASGLFQLSQLLRARWEEMNTFCLDVTRGNCVFFVIAVLYGSRDNNLFIVIPGDAVCKKL